ncbi:CAP domain-containing protein [Hoeflea prorocentri]|uniref:CAP domain-containing protein n=1 Tax=Hoeflea prorocentri TaxID=1922333 RepID=A0A9X3UM27_9HYPH|nr:CAP domain-containing protein [Hoeflea prorocentri]MCY6382895.1 CAP domain-containing protein [Hoeflea prorocentri]MDA5400695.1 CAP domain-containing protein [Hoeflea prorocentri]
MTNGRPFRVRFVRAAALMALGAMLTALAGCISIGKPDADVSDVAVNRSAALSKINAYRAANGLPRLTLDARLDALSQDMARIIAANDSMNTRLHSARGLSGRLDRGGYPSYAGAENLGAGYRTFDEALAGWKGSADHDKNLLNKHVTRMGIARAQRPDGRYRNFWVLILSRPTEDGRPVI